MKRINHLFKYNLYILAIFSILMIYSCRKSTDSNTGDGSSSFIVNIEGVESPVENITSLASNSVFTNTPSQEAIVYNENKTEEDRITIGFASVTENIATKIDAIKKVGNKVASTVNMPTGVKYVVLLINKTNNNNLEFITQGVIGQPLTIPAVKNNLYNIIAYSYNTTEDIALPNRNNLTIQTPDDKPLLYCKLENVSAASTAQATSIIFKHKLTELAFELDSDRLFATVSAADISLEFSDAYINSGKLNILTGVISDVGANYSKPIALVDHEDAYGKRNVKIARYYVANPTVLANYKVKIHSMKALFVNNVKRTLISATREASFTFTPPAFNATGKRLLGVVKLWYIFPTKKILHVTRANLIYNYAAESSELGGIPAASHHLLSENLNFGNTQNSVVRVGGFTHERCIDDATTTASPTRRTVEYFLNRPLESKPDIVIISVYYRMTTDDITALIDFLDHGGVVLLMTDGVNVDDMYAQVPFMRKLFNNNNVVLARNGAAGGSLYKFFDINDEILNGPFGNIIGKYWGEDASETTSLSNVPLSEITYYSAARPANNTGTISGELTMFKHKTKHLFWIGDGGFLSNELDRGVYVSYDIEPFATIDNSQNSSPTGIGKNPFPNTPGTRTHNNYPIPKLYGYGGGSPYIPGNTTYVYNSTLFANVMSWGILQSEFNGIRTGYQPIVSTDRPVDTSRGNAGF